MPAHPPDPCPAPTASDSLGVWLTGWGGGGGADRIVQSRASFCLAADTAPWWVTLISLGG